MIGDSRQVVDLAHLRETGTGPSPKSCGPTTSGTEVCADIKGTLSAAVSGALRRRLRPWTRHATMEVKDLAAATKLHPNTIQNWLGQNTLPGLDAFYALVCALDDKFAQEVLGSAWNGDMLIARRGEIEHIHYQIGKRLEP